MPPRSSKPTPAAGAPHSDPLPAFDAARVETMRGQIPALSDILNPYRPQDLGAQISYAELPDEAWAALESKLGFRPTVADLIEAGQLFPTDGTTVLPTSDLPGGNPSAQGPEVDALRVDGSDLRQVAADVGTALHTGQTPGVGEALPAGVGETSLEPGASMPDVSATSTRAAALEAVAAATLPPPRSPVFPAGADPAGAILEGRAGSVQSAASAWNSERAASEGGLLHPPKDGGPVRISAKREGFRRCGLSHPAAAKDYPPGYFSMTEIRELESEPMLVVQRLEWDQDLAV